MNIDEIPKILASYPVILFMKGDKFTPKCGFSKTAADILIKHNVDFATFDILEDPEVRQLLKEYSKWPTYPQLYINSELIGGSDILTEIDQNNELSDLFEPYILT